MRLIDADKLRAEFTGNFTGMYSCTAVKAMIDTEPTVDAVKVVRCKDCEFAEFDDTDEYGFCYCRNSGMGMKLEDFCSDGKKIEVEENV